MADNIIIPATGVTGTATPTVATDDVGGIHYQRIKLDVGGDGVSVPITNTSAAVPVSDASGSLTVDNAGTFATQDSQVVADNAAFADGTTKVFCVGFIYDEVAGTALTENDAGAARMNANRAVVAAIEDGATRGRYATVSSSNALKVDGSAVTQPVSAASLPLPSGAATAAKQPALGTAGTASADVLTVQGIASMTALKVDGSGVTQPVSIAASVTVDSELPAAAALADGAAAAPTTPTVGTVPLLMNASTVDRARAVVNALDSTGTGIAAVGLVAQLDDTSVGTVTENQFSTVRMGAKRSLHTQLRDAAGNDRGANVNSSSQLSVSVDNSNVSANVAQINGVAPSMGNGVSGTGVQRVTMASDSTGILAGVTTVTTVTTLSTLTGGGVAHDGVDAGNPVKIGGKGYAPDSGPSDVASGDRTDLMTDLKGRPIVYQATQLDPFNDGIGAARPNSQAIAVTTSGANYVSGDVVGGIISLSTVNYSSGRRVVLRTLQVNDAGGAALALNIYFFKATPTGGTYTDNAALAWSATADSGNKVGQVKIAAADYLTDNSQSSACVSGLTMKMPVAATTLFMLIVAQGSATLTNGNLTLNLEFDQE